MLALGRGISSLIPQIPKDEKEDKKYSDPMSDLLQSSGRHEKGGSQKDLLTPKTSGLDKAILKPQNNMNVSRETEKYDLLPVPGAVFAELYIKDIVPNTKQPRKIFNEEKLQELAQSIKQVGVLEPIVVRKVEKSNKAVAPYELIMGERRLRASKIAGKEKIPAVIRSTNNDDVLRDALLENLHRAELNPLEEASAYKQLLQDFGCTQEELASRVARSRSQVTNMLRLLKLPLTVQEKVSEGKITIGHARALLGLKTSEEMEKLASRIIKEDLSVRTVEKLVKFNETQENIVHKKIKVEQEFTPEIKSKITRLNEKIGLPILVSKGKRKGKITIEFNNDEQLEKILEIIS